MPSAFIPFCSYATKVAKRDHRSSFPACNSFKPVILEGQQCFQMILDRNYQTKAGKEGGVVIFLDTNNDRSVGPILKDLIETISTVNKTVTSLERDPEKEVEMKMKLFARRKLKGSDSGSKIYIQTLQGFTAFEAGRYVIRNIKKMSVKSNFLGMEANVRKCAAETFEECQMRSYIEAVTANCKCVPLALSSAMSGKVIFLY